MLLLYFNMRRNSLFIILIVTSLFTGLFRLYPDELWRYAADRYNRKILTDRVIVPDGEDPYAYFAEINNYSGYLVSGNTNVKILSEIPSEGHVPVLGLHKISREENFALTPERFRELLKYLNSNGWYPVSDYQYITGDFSKVPSGFKPVVLGADDASHGVLVYLTKGSIKYGKVKRFFKEPKMDPDCMTAILERYIKPEDGRINFTFYVSFDAIPFRQLDGYSNPGIPYKDIPLVKEKIEYLDKHFIIGDHTLSHKYALSMSPQKFASELEAAWSLLDEYAGGEVKTLKTMAFPYGIQDLPDSYRKAIGQINHNGKKLAGGFNFNNKPAPAPGALKDIYTVPRLNADNKHWESLMSTLDTLDAVKARRIFIWETDKKQLPPLRTFSGAMQCDEKWILVKSAVNPEL